MCRIITDADKKFIGFETDDCAQLFALTKNAEEQLEAANTLYQEAEGQLEELTEYPLGLARFELINIELARMSLRGALKSRTPDDCTYHLALATSSLDKATKLREERADLLPA